MAAEEYRWTGKPLKIGELEAEVPIIQGGMGVGISRSSLAGAVAKERRSRHYFNGADRV